MRHRIKSHTSNEVEVFAPAKINLFLAITSKRADGYHGLSSVLAKLAYGDVLRVCKRNQSDGINLSCPGFEDLENSENLVFRAATLWFESTGESWGADIKLEKRIPSMAGLGGGSSDAVSTLIALNQLGATQLSPKELIHLSAQIGSDCPSFGVDGLCFAEGRGEVVRSVDPSLAENLLGQKALLFRPSIGFSTAEVYKKLAEKKNYSTQAWAAERVHAWEKGELTTENLLHNDLETAVFSKHLYYRPLFQQIEKEFFLVPKMSGSGSACFVLIPEEFEHMPQLKELILEAWGDDCWVKLTQIID
jgi:4-diphosphocytidyl-2-C-methyl-D-erythritol kinase